MKCITQVYIATCFMLLPIYKFYGSQNIIFYSDVLCAVFHCWQVLKLSFAILIKKFLKE